MRKYCLTCVCLFVVFLILTSISFAAPTEIKFDTMGATTDGTDWQEDFDVEFFAPGGTLYRGTSYAPASLPYCLGGPDFTSDITVEFTDANIATDLGFHLVNPNNANTITAKAYEYDYVDDTDTVLTITSVGNQIEWFDFSSYSVHKVIISDSGTANQFAIDDVTFGELSTVPVPGALWLLGSGLIGLVAFRGRKRR